MENIFKDLDFTDFYVKGFIHKKFCGSDALDVFDKFKFPNSNSPDAQLIYEPESIQHLKNIENIVLEKIVRRYFSNIQLKSSGMWSSVDEGSQKWHNDYEDGDSFNSNILIYLDDNNLENGNSLAVRNYSEEFLLRPKRGELVWLNQMKCFQHKATHKSGNRRLLSFEFLIEDLLIGP